MTGAPSRNDEFMRLFEAYRQSVWSYCHRRIRPDDVPDAVAEVFTIVWRKLDRVPSGALELPWIYGVARNVLRNARRSTGRREKLQKRLLHVTQSTEPAADVHVERRLAEQELLRAVDSLKPIERELLRLRTWEELPMDSIAEAVGLSVRAVESRLARVRKKLAVALQSPAPGSPFPTRREGGAGP